MAACSLHNQIVSFNDTSFSNLIFGIYKFLLKTIFFKILDVFLILLKEFFVEIQTSVFKMAIPSPFFTVNNLTDDFSENVDAGTYKKTKFKQVVFV